MKTNTETVKNIILSVAIFVFILCTAFFWEQNNSAAVFLGIVSSVLLLFFIINIFKGGSCECFLQTAVQQTKLASAGRSRAAVKMVKKILPEIKQEQGVLSTEELDNTLQNSSKNPSDTKKRISPELYNGPPPFLWFKALFTLCLVVACFDGLLLFYKSTTMTIIASLITILFSITAIISAVKQSQRKIKSSLQPLAFAAIAMVIIDFIKGYASIFLIAINRPEQTEIFQNQFYLLKAISEINHFDYPVLISADCFTIITELIIGLSGFFLIKKHG